MKNELRWKNVTKGGIDIEAETEIGTYTISFDYGRVSGGANLWLADSEADDFLIYDTANEAKAVAQFHYDNTEMTLPVEIIDRYWNMLSDVEAKQEDEPGTSIPHIKWMISELRKNKEIGKHNRWLGFIQHGLITHGYTTTTTERNFTRPFFTKK